MPITIFTRNSFTKQDQIEQESGIIPIDLWKIRRKTSTGSYLSDRIALHKTLMLCSGCNYKMGERWKKTSHYCEITQFHAYGHCDGCKADTNCGMFVWEGSHWWQGIQDSEKVRQVRVRDAKKRLEDRRRF